VLVTVHRSSLPVLNAGAARALIEEIDAVLDRHMAVI
jgi:hypothetical protein